MKTWIKKFKKQITKLWQEVKRAKGAKKFFLILLMVVIILPEIFIVLFSLIIAWYSQHSGKK